MNTHFYVCSVCGKRVECHPTDPTQDPIGMVPSGRPGHYDFVCSCCPIVRPNMPEVSDHMGVRPREKTTERGGAPAREND